MKGEAREANQMGGLEIKREFQFEFCNICQMRKIKTIEMKMFSFDEIVEEDLTITCENAETCKYITNKIRQDGMIS